MIPTTALTAGPVLRKPTDDHSEAMDWQALLAADELVETVAVDAVNDIDGNATDDLTFPPEYLIPNPLPTVDAQKRKIPAGKASMLRAQGGVVGTDYFADVTVTTNYGNTWTRVAWFQCRER